MLKKWLELTLWIKVVIGLTLGVIAGVYFREKIVFVQPLGDLFIKLIKMIINPLIYFSLVAGVTGIKDKSSISTLTFKAMIAFLTTTAFAIFIGISAGLIFEPGLHLSADTLPSVADDAALKRDTYSLEKLIKDMIPDNAIAALAGNNVLQVVFFSFFTGIVLNLMKTEGEIYVQGFKTLAKLTFKMVGVILGYAPYAAFALTASIVGKQGIEVLFSLGSLVVAFLSAITCQYILFGVLIIAFAKISPMPFYRKSLEYQSLAFSTSSSKATLPTTMSVCAHKLGISKDSTTFILPLGAAINMDGMAIYLGICALFFAQAYHIHLSMIDYLVIIFTATLGSIGAAGIPGGSIIMLPMVLGSVGIPADGIVLIAGIDRVFDMLRTTLNITGDVTITLILDKIAGKLDMKTYMADSEKLTDQVDVVDLFK